MYKFFINDIEVNEPLEVNEIQFILAQDADYWGYFRSESIEKVTLIGESAKLIKNIYDNTFNPVTKYTIKKKSAMGIYNIFQECVIDYSTYLESILNGEGLAVSVSLLDNNLQGKLRNRESNLVVIGASKSIEGADVTSLPLISAQIEKKTLKYSAKYKFSELLQTAKFFVGAGDGFPYSYYPDRFPTYYYGEIKIDGLDRPFASFNARGSYTGTINGGSPWIGILKVPVSRAHLGLEVVSSNTELSNSSSNTNFGTYETAINLDGSRHVPKLINADYKPTRTNMLWLESGRKRIINIVGSIKLNIIWRHNIPLTTTNRIVAIRVELVKFYKSNNSLDYYDQEIVIDTQDTPTHTLHAGGVLDPISTDTELPPHTTTQEIEVNYNIENILQEPNATYSIRTLRLFQGASYSRDVVALVEDNGTDLEIFYYDELDENPTTTHKGQLIYETIQSNLEQILDSKNIFASNFFGRTDLGYAQNGKGSHLFLTNGLLLRNATFPNGDLPTLKTNFADLYKTIDAIYGLKMFYNNGKIHIEKRDWITDKEIELFPRDVKIYPLNDKMYTQVVVGNEKLTYDSVNGTNEFNNILTFSSPLNTKEKTLNLVTKMQTDYTGVENARRLSVQNSDTVDSQYDDKNFLIEMYFDGTMWRTKPILGNFSLVQGLILPFSAFNLGISPKRMLLNNIDIINAMLYKGVNSLRFESSDNLAKVISQEVGGDIIAEHANLTLGTEKYRANIFELTLSVKEAEKVFANTQNLYKVLHLGEYKKGVLYSVEDIEEETIVKLLEIKK